MTLHRASNRHRGCMMPNMMIRALLLAGLSLMPIAAQAQTAIEGRVDRLESEMRAVQRKVFPGGSGQYVQPDNAPRMPDTIVPGSPSNSPVTDLNARVDALEMRLTAVTGQVETASHRLQILEDAFNAYKRITDARLKSLEDGATATAGSASVEPAAGPATRPAPTKSGGTATTPAKPTTPATRDPARGARIAAIEKPVTGDPAEDDYIYGYRLYAAKLYPEAQAQLEGVVSKFPRHKRASYAQNLIGLSYLDDGKPAAAALAFYKSYKKFPDGDRAPDSLMNLAEALKALNKPAADICQVYDEALKYGPKLTAKIKADLDEGRAKSKCK
jgi:TolA-binding protein